MNALLGFLGGVVVGAVGALAWAALGRRGDGARLPWWMGAEL